MRMPPPTRLAACLLLVYPGLILARGAQAVIQYRDAAFLGDHLPLVLFLIAVSVYLWRGRRWAYAGALICSVMLAVIQVLYDLAGMWLWRSEVWTGWSAADHVLNWLPIAALAAAFALLVRDPPSAGARHRAFVLLAAALAAELVLVGLIAWLGVGSVFGPRPWYQTALGLTQAPGEMLLTQMGMCCGYENETIISDFIDPHWGGITRFGIPALVAANALGLVPLLALVRDLLVRRSGVRGAAPAVAG